VAGAKTLIVVNRPDLISRAAEKTSERVQKARVEFWEKIRDIRAEDLIFIDESGVNLAMVRL
jgi:hypothetical protein